jgi:hypothetical protein
MSEINYIATVAIMLSYRSLCSATVLCGCSVVPWRLCGAMYSRRMQMVVELFPDDDPISPDILYRSLLTTTTEVK